MGGSKKYNPDGGFSEQDYETIGRTANGIKIIELKNNKNNNTPMFSNTPNTMYAKTKNGKINQVAVYSRGKDHRGKLKDIDIGHYHENPDGKLKFQITDIHVHDYTDNSPHSKYARKPSKKERRLLMIAMYGKRKK
jgi:hypothetical protein